MSIKGFKIGGNVERVDYDYLDNKPNIPSKTSDLTNDSNFLSMAEWMNFAVADNPDLNRDDADLHALEQNKIYYRTSTSHSPAHLPYSSFTGIVVTYHPFAYNSGQVVLAISHDGKMFSCASSGAAPGTYSDWHEYSLKEDTISYQGQLTSADDMHNLRYPGMYYVSLSNPPTNFPFSGSGDFRVLVNKSKYESHYGETHFVMGNSALWVEKCLNGSDWSGWKQLADINEVIAYRGVLNSTNDIHDISYPGMYHIQLSSRPANFPYESDPGTSTARLLVNKSSAASNHNGETHFIMSSNALWVERSLNEAGTNWSVWRRIDDVGKENDVYISYPHKTASGSIASFKDGEYGIPVKDLSISIMSTQSGNGDPTPNNIRPIVGGWTAANIIRTGKNMLPNKADSSGTINGLSWAKDSDGVITVNGTASADTNIYICTSTASTAQSYPLASSLKNDEYVLTGCPSGGGLNTYRIVLNKNNAIHAEYFTDIGSGITVNKTDDFQTIDVYLRFNSGITVNDLKFHPMLRRASFTSSSYEKYNGTDINVSFPNDAGVVYGGILDLTRGILTVTKAKVALGSLSWTKTSRANNSGNWYYFSGGLSSVIQWPGIATSVPDIICSDYTTVSSNTLYNNASYHYENGDLISITAATGGNKGYVWILDSRHMSGDLTGDQFKAMLQSSGAEMVYTLAKPRTYMFSPIEVRTLYADNNIWADCGDTTIDYYANPDLYMTASTAIPSGKYFMVGDALYLSTAFIAAGAKIIVGTNCNMVNLADALNTINT